MSRTTVNLFTVRGDSFILPISPLIKATTNNHRACKVVGTGCSLLNISSNLSDETQVVSNEMNESHHLSHSVSKMACSSKISYVGLPNNLAEMSH